MDAVWEATQQPDQHRRWDVRFGDITYLPRRDGDPQRFCYATTVAPGVTIAGTGESLGDRDRGDGTRWSGLKFWAADRRSIIDAGAGYWRYVPTGDGVRFLTRYDYRPRWGAVGEQIDRWLSGRSSDGRRRGASTACACGSSAGSPRSVRATVPSSTSRQPSGWSASPSTWLPSRGRRGRPRCSPPLH